MQTCSHTMRSQAGEIRSYLRIFRVSAWPAPPTNARRKSKEQRGQITKTENSNAPPADKEFYSMAKQHLPSPMTKQEAPTKNASPKKCQYPYDSRIQTKQKRKDLGRTPLDPSTKAARLTNSRFWSTSPPAMNDHPPNIIIIEA